LQVQVLELYDPFSSFQFPELETMGFCARGTAARLSDEGVFDMDGRNAAGDPVASGVYFILVEAPGGLQKRFLVGVLK
jgi:hypothetical protein